MNVFKKIISVALASIICLGVLIIPISAIDIWKLLEKGMEMEVAHQSTAVAPEGYVAENRYRDAAMPVKYALSNAEAPKVLLVEDVLPWDSYANQDTLTRITQYDKVTTAQFLTVNLAEYGVIVFANDQPFSSYENYTKFKEYMELFASIGGVIVFGACDAGWSGGNLVEKLPGDVSKKTHYVPTNYVVDPLHPIVSASLSDGNPLVDDDLQSYWCSHVSFDENSLPAGTKIILRESSSDRPTLVEYPLGKGRVIASGLTWEHNYSTSQNSIAGYKIGDFAEKAIDDMFLYAIRVSSIDVEDVSVLEDYYLEQNAHHIVVAGEENAPLENAKIVIDGVEYYTDAKGEVKYKGPFGAYTVEVEADGYRKSSVYYELKANSFQMIFLDKDTGDGKPYVTMVSEPESYADLRYQTKRFRATSDVSLTLNIKAEWQGHGEGQYVIYQEDYQKTLTSADGALTFVPGRELAPDKRVKLKLVAGDGTESEPISLSIFVDSNYEHQGNDEFADMKLFDDESGSIDDETVAAIFPGSFDFKFPVIPFEHSKEINEDGTVIHKATLGVYGYDFRDKEGEWLSFKNIIDNCAKEMDKTDKAVEKALSKIKGKKWASSVSMNDKIFSADVDVLGYFEIVMDAKGNQIRNSGTVVIAGSGSADYTRLILLGPVPFYVTIGGELKIEFKANGLSYDFENKAWNLSLKPVANFEASGYLGGGVGISGLASVGAEGSIKLDIKLPPDSTGDVTVKAYLRTQLLFVIDWRLDIATKTFHLWPDETETYAMLLKELLSEGRSSIGIGSRDYVHKTSEWYGDSSALLSINEDSLWTLQEYIMPGTLPELVEVGGEYMLLFHSDIADRDVGNNVVLMYSRYDGYSESWSVPQPVAEDVSSDVYAEYAVIDGELYVVWQKISREVGSDNAEELLKQMCEGAEISFAKWNSATESFEQAYLTSDNTLDMYPQIAVSDDKMTVVWVANSANDPYGRDGTFSFYASDLENGVWSSPRKLFETDKHVSEIAAGYVGGELEVLYSIDESDGAGNVYIINGLTSELVSSEGSGTALFFQDGYFYWNSNGAIYKYDAASSQLDSIKSGDKQSINYSYRFVKNDNYDAIVWMATDADENTVIYASVETANGWSNPIAIYKPDFVIQSFDVDIADDGSWDLVFTALEDEDNVILATANVQPPVDTALNYVYFDEAMRVDGMQPVTFSVTNNGQSAVEKLIVMVNGADNTTLFFEELSCVIDAGATEEFELEVDLTGIMELTDLFIYVYAEGEADLDDNCCEESVGHVDVGVDVQYRTVGNNVIVTATVNNRSDISANTAISIIEDSLDGIVLDMKNIGVLACGESYVYIYSIDRSAIDFGENDYKYYYIKLDTLEADWNIHDNSEVLVLYLESETQGHVHYDSDGKYDTDGNSHWLVCADCGDPYDAASHVESDWLGKKEPTCTEDGYSEWKNCTVCGYVLEAGNVIPAKGHTETTVNAKEATCLEEGYTGDVICEDCGGTVQTGSVIPQKEHSATTFNAVEATCTNEGYSGDVVCADCDEFIMAGSVIPKVAHTETIVNKKEASCTESGSTGDVVCSVCGEQIGIGATIPKRSHNETTVNAKKPTSTKDGYSGDVVCEDCGELIKNGEVIPAKDKDDDDDDDAYKGDDLIVNLLIFGGIGVAAAAGITVTVIIIIKKRKN